MSYWLGLDMVRFHSMSRLGCFPSESHLADLKGAPDLPPPKTAMEAARNGYEFYKLLQSPDGHWSSEYGGPLFLLPGWAIALHCCGRAFREEQRVEIMRYLFHKRRKEGGWGL